MHYIKFGRQAEQKQLCFALIHFVNISSRTECSFRTSSVMQKTELLQLEAGRVSGAFSEQRRKFVKFMLMTSTRYRFITIYNFPFNY